MWELVIIRFREDYHDLRFRRVGVYAVVMEKVLTGIWGWTAEPGGPGDNKHAGNDLCIEPGIYGLQAHFGPHYRTTGYARGKEYPRPAIELTETGKRESILFHPGSGFLSSIGCLNPSNNLIHSNGNIDYTDSRNHVVRLLNHLKKTFGPDIFTSAKPIVGASVQIIDLVKR